MLLTQLVLVGYLVVTGFGEVNNLKKKFHLTFLQEFTARKGQNFQLKFVRCRHEEDLVPHQKGRRENGKDIYIGDYSVRAHAITQEHGEPKGVSVIGSDHTTGISTEDTDHVLRQTVFKR